MPSSSSSSDSADVDNIVGRKRKSLPSTWKQNIRKAARCRGEEYQTIRGNVVPAKTTGPECRCRRLRCFEKISDDDAVDLLKRLHDLPTKNEQDLFIQTLIEVRDVDRRRSRKGEGSRIVDKVFKYSVIIGNKKMEVCYKAFLSLFAISDKRVKRIRKLAVNGENPVDKRGKQASSNTLPTDVREKIRNHILSFPVKYTKYSGKKAYLDSRLSVQAIYNLFKEKYPEIKCSYQFFIKFFNDNFSLSFGRPQVDSCCTCEELNLKIKSPHINDAAKRSAAAELMIHRRRAKKFYTELKKEQSCKTEPHVLSICMDYMQNILRFQSKRHSI